MRNTWLPHFALQRHNPRYQNRCERNRSSSRVAAITIRSVSQDQFKLASGATPFRLPWAAPEVFYACEACFVSVRWLAQAGRYQVVKSCEQLSKIVKHRLQGLTLGSGQPSKRALACMGLK